MALYVHIKRAPISGERLTWGVRWSKYTLQFGKIMAGQILCAFTFI